MTEEKFQELQQTYGDAIRLHDAIEATQNGLSQLGRLPVDVKETYGQMMIHRRGGYSGRVPAGVIYPETDEEVSLMLEVAQRILQKRLKKAQAEFEAL